MTRREFLVASACAGLSIRLPIEPQAGATLRIAAITDLHHGLAPDAEVRFDSFLKEVDRRKNLDLVLQIGDFCHPGEASNPISNRWRDLPFPQANVLGNHDMDRGTKGRVMAQWGMKDPFESRDLGSFRLIILDLNHFKKNGQLIPYADGNYFTLGANHNWADPDQLAWLGRELRTGSKPTILVSHQPLGMGEPGKRLPDEQEAIFDILRAARDVNPKGAVCACLCGHLHVDRLENVYGFPCLCLNSASYFWSNGMHPYRDPLYSFLEFDPRGELRVLGRKSEFLRPPPNVNVKGMSATISDRRISLPRRGGWLT
jgi:3',5'-cyclic AMP phosphodiesterase CpdA